MKCENCKLAERKDRPDIHRFCQNGKTLSGISFDMSTGNSVWIEPYLVKCNCNHEMAVTA
jgi:hypothetical protein